MKLTEKQQLELAEEFLEGFTTLLKTYLVKMNLPFTPVTVLKYNENWKKILTLTEMIKVIDADLKHKHPDTYPNGVRSKNRVKTLVLRRQILFKMGREMGLNFEYIAKEFDLDHATIIHGVKTINNLLDTEDKDAKETMTEINNIIKQYYFDKYGKDFSEVDPSGDKS